MDRRSFLKSSLLGGAALSLKPHSAPLKTKHLIVIVNGPGSRKKDYYENSAISPNINKIAREGFVFEEDQCSQAASHHRAYDGLIRGFDGENAASPSFIEYVREAYREPATRYWHLRPGLSQDPFDGMTLSRRETPYIKDFAEAFAGEPSLERIPTIMAEFKPRILLFQQTGHDTGHHSYEDYLRVVQSTDQSVGKIADWIRNDPYFSTNTAIVIRPDFGRDDEPNRLGELHHSQGFYYSERVASIFWGPDFRQGVSRSLVHSIDFCPTLTHLFGVAAKVSQGQVLTTAFI